jgi:hypothetical protein
MSNEKLFEMISLYFDGELTKSEEPTLFALLSSDQSARDYFKQLSLIKNVFDNDSENLSSELEERILRSIGTKVSVKPGIFSNIRIFSSISYAAAIILLVLSGYLFLKVSNYQERVDNLSQQMMFQSRTIQMFYNSLPGVDVVGTIENKIVIKPKI